MTARPRRKLLVALASGGPQTAGELIHVGKGDGVCTSARNFLYSTTKHLRLMVEAGLVIEFENERDRRKTIYGLSPDVKFWVEGDDTVFDFGFLVARLTVDGD